MRRSDTNHYDHFLGLYLGCSVLIRQNIDVENGPVVNGSSAKLKDMILKPAAVLTPVKLHDVWVNSVAVEDVDCLMLTMEREGHTDAYTFSIQSTKMVHPIKKPYHAPNRTFGTFKDFLMELHQFPVVLNHASTTYKVQAGSLTK
jgi:hypothetical protein